MRSTNLLLASALALSSVASPRDALAGAATGKPTWKAEGPESIYLWRDDAGWHLRAVAGADQHAFRGTIRGAGFDALSVTRQGLVGKVALAEDIVRFEFDVFKGTVDGFDWKAPPGCVTIELKIDGKVQPRKVHLGAKGESPSLFPSDACP